MTIPDLHVVVSFYDRGRGGRFFSHRSSDIFLSGATRRRFVHCGEERGCFPGNQHYKSYHSFTYCAMHAYSDSPHSSGAFSPLEPVSKAPDGFYRDLYAIRSFGSLGRQQMHTRRIPASIHVVSKSCQIRWMFYQTGSMSKPVRLCGRSTALKTGFKAGTSVIGLATLLL